jgi:DNA-binding CsgD family transcriptional regulator
VSAAETPGTPTAGTQGGPSLVGRGAELGRLSAAEERAAAGAGQVVLLGGEGGIGKTSLVEAYVAQRQRGSVLWGRVPVPSGERLPYAAIVEVLRAIETEHGRMFERSDLPLGQLEPLLRGRLPAPSGAADPFARIHMLDALRALIDTVSREDPPLLLVLDDLHWADEGTLDALSYLALQTRATPLLLVATYRSDEVDSVPALARLLVELVRLAHVEHVELGRLPASDLLHLGSPTGALPQATLAELAGRAAGNPYFFTQLVRHAVDAAPGGAVTDLPGSLRELLLRRVRTLAPMVKTMARIGAVAGGSPTGRLLAAVLSIPPEQVYEGLRQLVEAHVLGPAEAPGDGYAFRHPLLQQAVLDELLPGEKAVLHGAVARALDADPGLRAPGLEGIVEAAIHWASADAGDTPAARRALLAGAGAAEQLHAYQLSHTFRELLLRHADGDIRAGVGPRVGFRRPAAESDHDRTQLLLRTAEMAHLAGRTERAVGLARRAVDAARRQGRADHLALERIGWYQMAAGDITGSLAVYREAAEAASSAPAAEQARVLASHGRALTLAGSYEEARSVLEAAIARARESAAAADESRALTTLGSVLVRLGQEDAGRQMLDQGRAIDDRRTQSLAGPRPSRLGYLFGAFLDHAVALRESGATTTARAVTDEAQRAADRLGAGAAWGGVIAATAAQELYLLGRWSEADEMLASARRAASPDAAFVIVGARLAIARGHFDVALAELEGVRPALGRAAPAVVVNWHIAQAELAVWASRPSDARAVVEDAIGLLDVIEDLTARAEVVALGLRADAESVRFVQGRRTDGRLQALREAALILAGEAGISRAGATPAGGTRSPSGRRRALRLLCECELSRILGPSDPALWASVGAAFKDLGEPYSVAQAAWREAEALLEQRRDRARAEDALRRAHAAATTLGALPLVREIDALAGRARLAIGEPREGRQSEPAGSGPDQVARVGADLGLSPRELEVLVLVADGMTNRQIASALFITEKTAGHHVSNILAKLGLSSRIEAAAVAYRRGLVEAPPA